MGGKSKKATVGYWYKLLYHAGLGYPIDAFLEFRGGDRTAWKGELTNSGTIYINAPNLWGGKKDQGGIVGPVTVLFGNADQVPDTYLVANLGNQVSAWRGFTTLIFKGGKYGAMNPYPQRASYKVRKIFNGWDGACWYPEKAAVPILSSSLLSIDDDVVLDANSSSPSGSDGGYDFTVPAGSVIHVGLGPSSLAWSFTPSDDYDLSTYPLTWTHRFGIRHVATGEVIGLYWPDLYITASAARAAHELEVVTIPAAAGGTYRLFLSDATVNDNRGVGSYSVGYVPAGGGAMNPAHVLYYARTHSTIGQEPIGNMNDASYRAAADKLLAEGFGICTRFDPSQESLEAFEKRIGKLIGGSVSQSLVDGQWYLDLARGDYVLEDLPILTDDDILDFSEQPTTISQAVNSLAVKYFDPAAKESKVTPAVRALGLIREFGEIADTAEYPEIPTASLALRVAERDLRASATPTRAFELKTTRKPNGWRPGTYFRLQAPKRGIADMVCIVGEKQSGQLRSGAMKLVAAQDIYGMPDATYVQVEPGVDTSPNQQPVAITLQRAFELPFIVVVATLSSSELADLAVDAGLLGTVAADPATSRDYTMMVSAAGAGTYAEAADGEWCPTATIVEASTTRMETDFTLSGGFKLDSVVEGSAALWGDEIVRVDAIDPDAGTVTVARGCADTVSATHPAGTRIWFFGEALAYPSAEYTAAESIDVKLLTNTGSRQLGLGAATPMALTFNDRLNRPYPPGLLKIDGADYPAAVEGEFIVTWAHRNRESQADQLVDASVASVTPANNVRYGLRLKRVDTGALLVERTDIGPATATVDLTYSGNVSLELWTIDNNNVSWQSHLHTFAYTAGAAVADTITATAYTPVDDATIIDGGGD